MGLCLCRADLHQVSAVSAWMSQAPHGSLPVNVQRFSVLTHGLLLQSTAAAQVGLLSPQLTEGAMPRLHTPRMRKVLAVHLFGR